MTSGVYLDYNATTPVKPAVARAVAEALAEVGNPSSVHGFGRAARRAVEDARARVAALLGCDPAAIVFTSGGTEANNLALGGCGGRRLLVSAVEHPSVLDAARALAREVAILPVDGEGLVDLPALASELERSEGPALVSVMLANNETGVIQPVAEIAEIAHERGALFHCDAVQGPGRIPLDVMASGADILSVSAHKLGGPKGVGALVLAREVELEARQIGGGQERSRRAGTENVPGIVGFGVAAALALEDLAEAARLAALRDEFEARLAAVDAGVRVFGAGAPRLPNTSCVTMPGVPAETQVMALDLEGVAVSAGSACSSGKVEPSHVLRAMGASETAAASAIRVSLGWASQSADVERLVEAWKRLHHRIGTRRGAREGALLAPGGAGLSAA